MKVRVYRLFVEWLVEAYYLRMFLQLSHIPHYTTLQKFSSRINGTLLEKIISSFILLLTNVRKIFTGIDSTGFKITHASQYYTERTGTRRKYAKLSIGADVLQQIICTIKIRRAPTRHDNIDFRPIITKTSEILPLSVVTADKAYDSEENHVLVRELLHGFSIIPTRYENVPIWKTHGRYRKQMKRGYSKLLYGQRNKNETIVSVIKRLFGEHITSRLVRTQNRELSFRCIAYNTHRITNLTIIIDGFYKAEPIINSIYKLVNSEEEIIAMFEKSRDMGHEGLVLKNPDSYYHPGKRGRYWVKLKKELDTIDAVIIIAEYGHGKRAGVLSDYTFAVRDDDSNSVSKLRTIGKAYSGLTDDEILETTKKLKSIIIKDEGTRITVRPEIILEVAFDSIQKSNRHDSGFPRIKNIREDKNVSDIDSLQKVKQIYEKQTYIINKITKQAPSQL